MKIYPPALTGDHQEKVAAWRGNVVESIRKEEETYVRETTFDRLFGIMFPEMRPALSEPFGTPLYIPEREREYDGPIPVQSGSAPASVSAGLSAQGQSDDIDAALLQASGYAVGNGQSPLSFAKNYVRRIGDMTVEQVIHRLIARGVAKNRWWWS